MHLLLIPEPSASFGHLESSSAFRHYLQKGCQCIKHCVPWGLLKGKFGAAQWKERTENIKASWIRLEQLSLPFCSAFKVWACWFWSHVHIMDLMLIFLWYPQWCQLETGERGGGLSAGTTLNANSTLTMDLWFLYHFWLNTVLYKKSTLCSQNSHEYMKLTYTESDHWSVKVNILYSNCQQLSKVTGWGLSTWSFELMMPGIELEAMAPSLFIRLC